MARKASTRGQKTDPRLLTKRELQGLDRLLDAAGGWKQLHKQHREWRKSPRIGRGRPPIDTVSLIDTGGPRGMRRLELVKLVGNRVAWIGIVLDVDREMQRDVIARYKKTGKKPPPFLTRMERIRMAVKVLWETCEQRHRDETLTPAERDAWNPHHLGKDDKVTTRRLINELRKRGA